MARKLSDHEVMQMEQAAQGCVSGTLSEWPHLHAALVAYEAQLDNPSKPPIAGPPRKHGKSLTSKVLIEEILSDNSGKTTPPELASQEDEA